MSLSLLFFIVVGGLTWVALLRSVDIPSLFLGAVVIVTGWVIARRIKGPGATRARRQSVRAVAGVTGYLLVRVLPSIVRGTWVVVKHTLSRRLRHNPALLPVRLPGISQEALFLLSFATGLSPDRQVAFIDEDHDTIYVDVLDAPEPDVVQREVEEDFRHYLEKIFP
jgi:multisubunit Na+/H+ antiporter MnhE subunit